MCTPPLQNDSLATLLARLEGILGEVPQWMIRKGRYSHRYYTRQGLIYERSSSTVSFDGALLQQLTGWPASGQAAASGLVAAVPLPLQLERNRGRGGCVGFLVLLGGALDRVVPPLHSHQQSEMLLPLLAPVLAPLAWLRLK